MIFIVSNYTLLNKLMNNKKYPKILISDFDGTISKVDFFYYVVDNLLKPSDMQPWYDYLDKKITHIDSLIGIFGKIHLSQPEFDNFILNLPIQEGFVETVHYCKENDIPFYIISAGADYYIKLNIRKASCIYDYVKLLTNKSVYTQECGLQIIKPEPFEQYYSLKYGIDKEAIVKSLKEKAEYTIFAGDGKIDFKAAKLTDKIFAKDHLLKLCHELEIDVTEIGSYNDILDFLKKTSG